MSSCGSRRTEMYCDGRKPQILTPLHKNAADLVHTYCAMLVDENFLYLLSF